MKTDNYFLTCEYWRKVFLGLDHEQLIRRFRLQHDSQALYIRYFCQLYRIDRESGSLTLAENPEKKPDFNTQMAIYNLFYYSRDGARVCGRFVPFREVKGASPFDPAFRKSVAQGLALPFSGRLEALKKACLALEGTPVPYGDAGYIIQAFDFMPVMLCFWDGDEEFEAQANVQFDADITDFLHEETVCCIAADLMRRLGELC